MQFWGEYVPVAQRRANALRKMAKLRKKGNIIQPVEIDGRTIARSFWGKGWCDHLESFSDYENRLPRGRRYVRNGSVCHLAIHPGKIEAIVSGSELYNVSIGIKKLRPAIWDTVKVNCSGQIGSMLELLQGKLSDQVMTVVTDRANGLFPQPREIELRCDCPDWAIMCKHVAAAMYGVGRRLDHEPELLFLLRDVDAQELISTEMTVPDTVATSDAIDDERLGDIFGIELDDAEDKQRIPKDKSKKKPRTAKRAVPSKATKKLRSATRPKTTPAKQQSKHPKKVKRKVADHKKRAQVAPKNQKQSAAATRTTSRIRPTGRSVARLRKRLGLSVVEFARQLNVSTASVYRWESTTGRLKLQPRPFAALAKLQQQGSER